MEYNSKELSNMLFRALHRVKFGIPEKSEVIFDKQLEEFFDNYRSLMSTEEQNGYMESEYMYGLLNYKTGDK